MKPADMGPEKRVAIIVSAWLFTIVVADAGELRKCRSDAGGHHHYVSGDCPAGTREVWMREVQPEPVDAVAVQKRQAELNRWQQRSRARGAAGRGSSGRSRGPTDKAGQACETAKRRRDEVRDRDWYTLTLDQLRALDDRVSKACRQIPA